MTIGSLFSGIGGLELGLERAGLGPVIWQAESEPYCRQVLAKHWPGVTIYDDVRKVDEHAERPDIICGGFPCQDISDASRGRGGGIAGERSGLWQQLIRVVQLQRPTWVVVENVDGAAWRTWVPVVRRALADIDGYASVPLRMRAADVAAPRPARRARPKRDGERADRPRMGAPLRARGIGRDHQAGDRALRERGAITMIHLTVVVAGMPVELSTSPKWALRLLVEMALSETDNEGQPPAEWELRNADGLLFEQGVRASDAALMEGMVLYLSPRAGAGGTEQKPATKRLVIVESPYAGDVEANVAYLKRCLLDCIARGEAPLASHLFYTQFLDDTIPEERKQGMEAGLAWGRVADATVVYTDRGESRGMLYGIACARVDGREVEYRKIGDPT